MQPVTKPHDAKIALSSLCAFIYQQFEHWPRAEYTGYPTCYGLRTFSGSFRSREGGNNKASLAINTESIGIENNSTGQWGLAKA